MLLKILYMCCIRDIRTRLKLTTDWTEVVCALFCKGKALGVGGKKPGLWSCLFLCLQIGECDFPVATFNPLPHTECFYLRVLWAEPPMGLTWLLWRGRHSCVVLGEENYFPILFQLPKTGPSLQFRALFSPSNPATSASVVTTSWLFLPISVTWKDLWFSRSSRTMSPVMLYWLAVNSMVPWTLPGQLALDFLRFWNWDLLIFTGSFFLPSSISGFHLSHRS